jgi:acetyl esterase/lipase
MNVVFNKLRYMPTILRTVCLASLGLGLLAACGGAHANTMDWQPSAGRMQIPIWPGVAPDAQPVPGAETATVSKELLAGKPATAVTNVTRPTMTVYAPEGKNTGAAVVVIPGGGFQILAIDLERHRALRLADIQGHYLCLGEVSRAE